MSEIGEGEIGLHPQPKVEIKSPFQEASEPTENLIENFDWLFRRFSQVTRARFLIDPAKAKHYEQLKGIPEEERGKRREIIEEYRLKGRSIDQKIERPLFARTKRAELRKQLKGIPEEERGKRIEIFYEAHLRDGIVRQYLNQGEIAVTLSFGEQKSRYINVVPPEAVKTPENESKPPIFLIPGISNDIECVGGLVEEMAMQGRRVIVVAHPESFKGRVTKEFADAVEADSGYGPHIEFYKQAINSLMKKGEDFELWGYSTGASIVEGILNDREFQDRTKNAVLLCPASSVNQSKLSMNMGIVNELKMFINKFKVLPRTSYTKASKDSEDEEQIPLRKRVFGLVMNRVMTHMDYLEKARVQKEGSIVVVSGRKDRITKSSRVNKKFLENSQVRVLDLKNGYHASPGVEAEKVLPLVFSLQEGLESAPYTTSAKI